MTAVWEEGRRRRGVGSGQLVQWEGSSKVLRAPHFCFRKNHNQIVQDYLGNVIFSGSK